MGIWDMGTVLTSHTPFAEGLYRTGKGIEEPALGPTKVSRGQGQPAETQRSDVIGKCSNQGSRRVNHVCFNANTDNGAFAPTEIVYFCSSTLLSYLDTSSCRTASKVTLPLIMSAPNYK